MSNNDQNQQIDDKSLEEELQSFYNKLLRDQVEPDAECMRVLYENLFDLYTES